MKATAFVAPLGITSTWTSWAEGPSHIAGYRADT